MNFDAAVNDGKVACAYIIRDVGGFLLVLGTRALHSSSVFYAELMAAWIGMLVAVTYLKASNIWLDGDSKQVVSFIKNSSLNAANNLPILNDILIWAASCSNFTVTPPEEQTRPDFIAKAALNDLQADISHIVSNPSFQSILQADISGNNAWRKEQHVLGKVFSSVF